MKEQYMMKEGRIFDEYFYYNAYSTRTVVHKKNIAAVKLLMIDWAVQLERTAYVWKKENFIKWKVINLAKKTLLDL